MSLIQEHPWLKLPEGTDREAVIARFKEVVTIPSMPCRALGDIDYLRGDARALKSYLLAVETDPGERHFVYRAPDTPGVLVAVSLAPGGVNFTLAGSPPPGPFWEGDFIPSSTSTPGRPLRRTRAGDRFLYKSAARTGGRGYETETTLTCEPTNTADVIQVTTTKRQFTPTPETTVSRALMRQGKDGQCYELGPVGEEFEFPVISRRSPMAVGQYYTTLYYFKDICCEEHVTVAGTEEITVPAGTFQTFRLELQTPFPQRTSWFAPRLNAMVKETVEHEGYISCELLHEYTLIETGDLG